MPKIKTVTLPASIHRRIKERSDKLGMKLAAYVVQLLERALVDEK